MRKHIFLILFIVLSSLAHAQSRGVKIGYIDMEYILQNVPDYTEAKNQLEQKAQKWKQEIETKKNEVARLKDVLQTERVLLTKELLEEREEEITFQEKELLDYQEKRFGPKGDLTIQKAVLAQPVQDQVFNAAQDIAEIKKYDFIFDKTSDLTILFAAKRYDISDQVIRAITRTNKRNQLTKKQLKEEEKKEALENMEDESPALAERNKKLQERKDARDKLIADRKLIAEDKKKGADLRKQEALAIKEAKRTGQPVPVKTKVTDESKGNAPDSTAVKVESKVKAEISKKVIDSTAVVKRQKAAEDRAQTLADRKKVLEDKKKKADDLKESKKSAQPVPAKTKVTDESKGSPKDSSAVKIEVKPKAEPPKKEADSSAVGKKQKTAEDRAQLLADRKKALEDKKKKALEDREDARKAREEKAKENKKN